jgi:uncharacterized C2H2 Zn-finger protein
MSTLTCRRCETVFPEHDGSAKVAESTLIAAPAVPDMATQVRCPKCGYVFPESETRYLRAAGRPWGARLAAMGAALAAWFGWHLGHRRAR